MGEIKEGGIQEGDTILLECQIVRVYDHHCILRLPIKRRIPFDRERMPDYGYRVLAPKDKCNTRKQDKFEISNEVIVGTTLGTIVEVNPLLYKVDFDDCHDGRWFEPRLIRKV